MLLEPIQSYWAIDKRCIATAAPCQQEIRKRTTLWWRHIRAGDILFFQDESCWSIMSPEVTTSQWHQREGRREGMEGGKGIEEKGKQTSACHQAVHKVFVCEEQGRGAENFAT